MPNDCRLVDEWQPHPNPSRWSLTSTHTTMFCAAGANPNQEDDTSTKQAAGNDQQAAAAAAPPPQQHVGTEGETPAVLNPQQAAPASNAFRALMAAAARKPKAADGAGSKLSAQEMQQQANMCVGGRMGQSVADNQTGTTAVC